MQLELQNLTKKFELCQSLEKVKKSHRYTEDF